MTNRNFKDQKKNSLNQQTSGLGMLSTAITTLKWFTFKARENQRYSPLGSKQFWLRRWAGTKLAIFFIREMVNLAINEQIHIYRWHSIKYTSKRTCVHRIANMETFEVLVSREKKGDLLNQPLSITAGNMRRMVTIPCQQGRQSWGSPKS